MKTIIKTSLLIVIAMLLISANAFATNGMRMIGFGPVQNSGAQRRCELGHPYSVWSIETYFWRWRRDWRLRPGSYFPGMDGNIDSG